MIERYGVAPELVPDFIGLKGDTSDNIPGVPGSGTRPPRSSFSSTGRSRSVLAHVDEISGAKRQQNLREHADLARISKELATLQRDIDTGIDVAEVAGAAADRSRLREMFMRFELREPLRRLEEALGEQEAAPRARGRQRIEARARESSSATSRRCRTGRRRSRPPARTASPVGGRRRRRGAPGRRREPARAAARLGRPAADRPRLEVDQPRAGASLDDEGADARERSGTTR